MKNIIVLTHKNCTDGFGAAWVIYYHYFLQERRNIKYSLKYIFVDPSNPHDALEEFKEYSRKIGCYLAYSFDVGYNYENFKVLINIFPNIMILDHHISSYNDIKNNMDVIPKNYIFNNKKSGATLAWDYFYPDIDTPLLLKYIEDRDLWKFEMRNSRVITEGIYSFLSIGDFSKWTEFVENEHYYIKKCEELGELLIDIKEQRNAVLVDKGKVIEIDGNKAFVINTTENVSSLGEYIYELMDNDGSYMCDYALIWHYNMEEDKYFVSLRSNSKGSTDVSKIAKSFSDNGGGHKNAAGFSCEDIFKIIRK